MYEMRQQHWFWLAAICLVSGLTMMWAESLPLGGQRPAGEQLVRRRADLPADLPAPAQLPPQLQAPPTPVQIPPGQESIPLPPRPDALPANRPPALSRHPLDDPDPLASTQFDSPPQLGVPESVWLSGAIEPLPH